MKNKLLAGLGVMATTTALLTATAPSASADTTDVTFSLGGGLLSVSAQPTAPWGAKGNSGATSISGALGSTVLTDNRGGTASWSVGASRGTFTDGTTNATAVSYSASAPITTGTVVATSTSAITPTTLTAISAAVMNGTIVVGNNTATWNPTVTVTLPSSSTAGDYAGTITTSLL